MALRDQPYFPFYADDFLTDEKLNLCSAASQGVFVKMMCIFHKSDPYGGILFKQKDKQNSSLTKNFALKLARLLPFDTETIEAAIIELLEEGVLTFENDFLFQKRMVKDFEISLKRSQAAKLGGGNPNLFKQKSKQSPKQTDKQNTEYEYVNEYVNDNDIVIKVKEKKESKKIEIVKTENSPQFEKYELWAETNLPDLLKFKQPLESDQLDKLLTEFPKELVLEKLEAIGNTQNTTKKYKSVYFTCRSWCRMSIEKGYKPPAYTNGQAGQDVWSKTLAELNRRTKEKYGSNETIHGQID